MTATLEDIRKLKTYLVDEYHGNRVTQQQTDDRYVQDNITADIITLTDLPKQTKFVKTGKAYRMVSAPAERIITKNPQLYRDETSKGDIESAKNIAKEGNRWMKILTRQNPQPFKEHVKKLLGKGEAWIYTPHNEKFDSKDPNSLPAHFMIPDPTTVFIDPWAGETNGVPNRVIISFERTSMVVKRQYPLWEQKGRDDLKVPFFMYFDKEIRYFEADEQGLLRGGVNAEGDLSNGNGIQKNIYGLVPFVHSYAGFGESSPDGDPASLCISRITKVRDLIAEYTAIRSTLNTLIFKFGFPPIDIIYDPRIWTPPENWKYERTFLALNLIPVPAEMRDPIRKGIDQLPDIQLFQHLAWLESEIDREDPLGQIGQAIGDSGRQQLDAVAGGLRRYDSVVENSQSSFETAIGNILRMIDGMPSIRPSGISKGDIKKNYQVRIELKAEDPVANQIKSADGDRKQGNRIIDHETNLVEFQGYTRADAEEIADKVIVEDVILQDPIIRRLIAIQIAREMGMEEEYANLEQQLGQMEKGLTAQPQTGSEGGPPRVGNVKTPRGVEETDMSLAGRPTRRSPAV